MHLPGFEDKSRVPEYTFQNTVRCTAVCLKAVERNPEYTFQNTVRCTSDVRDYYHFSPEYTFQNTVRCTSIWKSLTPLDLNTPFRTQCDAPVHGVDSAVHGLNTPFRTQCDAPTAIVTSPPQS